MVTKSSQVIDSTIHGLMPWTTSCYQSFSLSCSRHVANLALASTGKKLARKALSTSMIQQILMIESLFLMNHGSPQASNYLKVTSWAHGKLASKSVRRTLNRSFITQINWSLDELTTTGKSSIMKLETSTMMMSCRSFSLWPESPSRKVTILNLKDNGSTSNQWTLLTYTMLSHLPVPWYSCNTSLTIAWILCFQ